MNVLLSIKPEYAREIFEGRKRYEFRRSIFKERRVDRAYVYVTSPVSKVIGSFRVGKILEGAPSTIWKKCRKSAGISKEAFFTYFKGTSRAFAIQIIQAERFNEGIDPYIVFDNFTPPQSFCYLPASVPELNPFDRVLTDFE